MTDGIDNATDAAYSSETDTASADPILSNGQRRSRVLPPSVVARPNGHGRIVDPHHHERKHRYSWQKPLPPRPRRACWLIEAVYELDAVRVEALLTCPGIRVDKCDTEGNTALLAAAWLLGRRLREQHSNDSTQKWAVGCFTRMIVLLVQAGANVNALNNNGLSVLTLVGNCLDMARILLKAGANPMRGTTGSPLSEAIRNGDEYAVEFWFRHTHPTPNSMAANGGNPWKVLMPYLLVPQARKHVFRWTSEASKKSPAINQRAAWAMAKRLVRAGYNIDLPLDSPTPKPPKKDEYGCAFSKDLYDIDDALDTPLVLACRNGDMRAVDRLLALGANPHLHAPNGRHPFMVWLSALWKGGLKDDPEKKWLSIHRGALRFLSPELISQTAAYGWRGWAGYDEVHPLACVLRGPCRAKSPQARAAGWELAYALLGLGLTCPLPQGKDVSITERVIGCSLSWFRIHEIMNKEMGDREHEDNPFETLALFLKALPGWRESQEVVCPDPWSFTSCLVKEAKHPFGAEPLSTATFAQFSDTGLRWDVAVQPSSIPHSSIRKPLFYLCKHQTQTSYGQTTNNDQQPIEQKPLSLEAIAFFLALPVISQEERREAFNALIDGGPRKGRNEAFSLFHTHGFDIAGTGGLGQGSPLMLLARHATTDTDVMHFFFRMGLKPNADDMMKWPREKSAMWSAWEMDAQLKTVLDPHTRPASRRARL